MCVGALAIYSSGSKRANLKRKLARHFLSPPRPTPIASWNRGARLAKYCLFPNSKMYGWRAKIGRISPSPETVGCEEWRRALPAGVCLVETRTLLHDVTVEGLTETIKQVERAALELASA